MNDSQIADDNRSQIRGFLVRHVGGQFPDNADLFATGRINSLFALQLVLFVEKQFGIRVDNEDLDPKNFRSVDEIGEFVARKRCGRQRSKE